MVDPQFEVDDEEEVELSPTPAPTPAVAPAPAAAGTDETVKKINALLEQQNKTGKYDFLLEQLEKDPSKAAAVYAAISGGQAPSAQPSGGMVPNGMSYDQFEAAINDGLRSENPARTIFGLIQAAAQAVETSYIRPQQRERFEAALDSFRDKRERKDGKAFELIAPEFERFVATSGDQLVALDRKALNAKFEELYSAAAGSLALKRASSGDNQNPFAFRSTPAAPTGDASPPLMGGTGAGLHTPDGGAKGGKVKIPASFVRYQRQAGASNEDILEAWELAKGYWGKGDTE